MANLRDEALARAVIPLLDGNRKRYLRDDNGVLGTDETSRFVKARLNKPSQVQTDEQHVTEGVLGISNPGLYKKGLRWKDAFTSDKTAVYYVWDKPTNATVWPQGFGTSTACTMTVYPGIGGSNPYNIAARNNPNQLSNFLFLTTLRRTIRENKNPNGFYTMYQWYGKDGSVDFKIAGSADGNTSYSVVIPGGAIYAPPGAGSAYTSMVTQALDLGVTCFASGAGTTIPASQFSAIHGQFLPGMTYEGRTYIWNDGYSGSGGYSQSQLVNAGVQNSNTTTAASVGVICDSTDTAPSAALYGDLQLGGLIVQYGTNPLPEGQHFEVSVWRYNTKQPILYATRSGAGSASYTAGRIMFACNITTPDYYAVEVTISGQPGAPSGTTAVAAGQGIFNFRILQINNGEMWAHTMTPNLCTLANFGSIVASRCFGTSILATNTTPDQYLAGTFAGAQPAATTEWQAVVNGQTTADPYSYIIQTLGEKDMKLKNGAYGFVRPTEVEQMKLQSTIIANQTPGAVNPYIFAEPLADKPFYCLVLTSPGGVYVQTIQFSFDHNGEFVTRNQILDTEASRFSPQQWMLIMEVLTSMDQTFENHEHNAETVLASLGKKVALADQIGDTILKWAPHVLKAGALAWQYALPLLAAAA